MQLYAFISNLPLSPAAQRCSEETFVPALGFSPTALVANGQMLVVVFLSEQEPDLLRESVFPLSSVDTSRPDL